MNEIQNDGEKKLLRLLGLCTAARKTVIGTEAVCDELRESKKIKLVIVASDLSDNTAKRIGDKCDYYGVRKVAVSLTVSELGHLLGKSGGIAVVGVADESFAKGMCGHLPDGESGKCDGRSGNV